MSLVYVYREMERLKSAALVIEILQEGTNSLIVGFGSIYMFVFNQVYNICAIPLINIRMCL